MHPILAERGRLALYLAAWAPLATLLAALLALSGDLAWGEAFALAVPLALLYAFVCLSAWYVCRALPLHGTGAVRLLVGHLAPALVSSGLWLALGRALAGALSELPPLAGVGERLARQSTLLLGVGVLLYLLAVAAHYLIVAIQASREAESRALRLEVLGREAELRALKAQVNPHFLFNSLNSIAALAASDPAATRRMCLLLAEFMRQSLRAAGREGVALSEELALAEGYLKIEAVRFGPRLAVERRIDESSLACRVPPLILQPLVENAVNHGIAQALEGGTVRLEARREGGRLEVLVENPCEADRPRRRGHGVGLENVRRRLAAFYGPEARMEVREEEGRFRVSLTVPALEAEARPPEQPRPGEVERTLPSPGAARGTP